MATDIRTDRVTDSIREYAQGWQDKMIEIWRDRLDLLGVRDTGALRASVQKGHFDMGDAGGAMAFRYLQYGIYVDLGVGNGYRRDNGGDLEILNPTYRLEHKMGKKRERRLWFSRSWYISTMVLKDKLADVIGQDFAGLFDTLTDRERG